VPAFVFPGQGSQRPGMGRPWTDHPSWELVADASEATGRDLARLLLDAGHEELTETRNAQLATVTMSLLVLDAVERVGIEPTAVAGHSVGEYTALIAAAALGFEDGLRVVAERGEAMQAAADGEPGVMLLVSGTDRDTVAVACSLAEGDVWLANYNSPDETVIAGQPEAVERAGQWALKLGARRLAPVAAGGAFHTPYMRSARSRLRKALSTASFHAPEVPVVANVDGRAHTGSVEWSLLLSAQLSSPVRWHQTIASLGASGERLFVELGAGSSLSGMVRTCLDHAETVGVSRPDDLDRLVDAVVGDEKLHAITAGHHGEHLYVSERVVVSPGAGIFSPTGGIADPQSAASADRSSPLTDTPSPLTYGAGEPAVEVGTLLGTVSGSEVRSPFAGHLMGMLAHAGERVQAGQPIAWLRAS
jgi:[acyl-carrier-protein] S-malonyltransferase